MDATQGYDPNCWSQRYAEDRAYQEWKQRQAAVELMREAERSQTALRQWMRKELHRLSIRERKAR